MVFCYKTITTSPRRSPRKLRMEPRALSARAARLQHRHKLRTPAGSSSMSELMDENTDFDSIPEKEWRLLAALARKREEEKERERLAAQFRKMWQKEKEGREMMETQVANEYNRFIHRKREDERVWLEHRRMLQTLGQQLRKGELLDAIQLKERRARELLEWRGDMKATELMERAADDEARALLAAERRSRQQSLAEWRRQLAAEEARRRADDAERRRDSFLRDSSRRLAIARALSTWETSFLRSQLAASEAAQRARYSALAALAAQRGERLARARAARARRARALAAKCEQWRDAIRNGCF